MKVRDYESFVAGSVAFMPITDDAYNVIGLCGEAGEVAEWIKKRKFRGNTKYTEDMLKKELGDVQHYLTRIAVNHGWTLKEIMEENMTKLMGRMATVQEAK